MFRFRETDFLVLGLLIVSTYLSHVMVKWMDDLFILLHCQVQRSGICADTVSLAQSVLI